MNNKDTPAYPSATVDDESRAAKIVRQWPEWKQKIRLTKYSPETDTMGKKDMPDIYTADDINPTTDCRLVLLEDCATIKEENERLKNSESINEGLLYQQNKRLLARVAELESLVRDIRQHDIDETTKRILDGGRKFNYSLPLNIRERIAAALKDPANEG